ncbi:glycosyltransferase family 4 protein [bacterium]|nr:glycosyltransferase family 4 protein [bacterium]
MKVCHLTSVHIPFDTRIFHKECRSLADAGYEVHLVAPHDRDEVVDGVRIHAVRRRHSKLKRMMFSPVDVLRKALKIDAPLYHFHDPELIPAGLILRALGKSVIYDVHEDYPETVPNKQVVPRAFGQPAGLIMRLIERCASPLFSAVVVVTPAIHARFRSYTGKTHLIYNFPIVRDHGAIPWESREDAVCYLGSIASNRGILEMVKAIALVREKIPAKLILAGDFTSKSLEREISALPEFSSVEYHGFVEFDESDKLLARAKAGLIVVHPEQRYRVSYPNKLFEYMMAGIPVIASDFPLWREMIEESQCGILVDPLDPDAIADAIVTMLQNPGEAQAMGTRGHEAAKEKYRWENENRKLLTLYESLPGGHS